MGKTSKPLKILLAGLEETPELAALREKGHEIHAVDPTGLVRLADIPAFDLILGPNCWRMDKDLCDKYLDVAVAAARKVRYPKSKTEAD